MEQGLPRMVLIIRQTGSMVNVAISQRTQPDQYTRRDTRTYLTRPQDRLTAWGGAGQCFTAEAKSTLAWLRVRGWHRAEHRAG